MFQLFFELFDIVLLGSDKIKFVKIGVFFFFNHSQAALLGNFMQTFQGRGFDGLFRYALDNAVNSDKQAGNRLCEISF